MLMDLLMACVAFLPSGEVWLRVLARDPFTLCPAAQPAAQEYYGEGVRMSRQTCQELWDNYSNV